MALSMTGYGKSAFEFQGSILSIEIKSLNSRYLDLNLRIPALLREKENEIRRYISDKLERGKIDVMITLDSANMDDLPAINKTVFIEYYRQLQEIARELNQQDDHLFSSVLRIPHIWTQSKNELDEHLWFAVERHLILALDAVNDFRHQEGSNLVKDLENRIREIEKGKKEVEVLAPLRIQSIRERIQQQIEELRLSDNLDQNRFEQELIYYLEKLDINEELVRLDVHCRHFEEVLAEKKSQKGRKLNFIAQEIGREINTIGSKANDSGMQQYVVSMKDELEKIKEQLNNLL